MGMRSPFMRNIGGTPTARCTSEQPCCMPSKEGVYAGHAEPILD